MATLADELLNDFEDSGSEGEGDRQDGFLQDESTTPPIHGGAHRQNGSMVLDGDEEEEDDEEEVAATGASKDAVAEVEDEDEAKAKVEKMQLGGVNDVRNVASLMKTLEPILKVRSHFRHIYSFSGYWLEFTSCPQVALTFPVADRKYHTTKAFLQTSRLNSSAPLKTTLNIIYSRNQIRSPLPSTMKSSLYINTFETITRLVSQNLRPLSAIRWITPNQ